MCVALAVVDLILIASMNINTLPEQADIHGGGGIWKVGGRLWLGQAA